MGTLSFNGVNCKDLGIVVETFPDREYPEKDVTITHIPGAQGDLIIDSENYKNVNRVYNIAILATRKEPFQVVAAKISKWLHSAKGYARLEDSYEPEVFRLAAYSEGNKVTSVLREAGRASVTFQCLPQRYLKLGESVHTLTSSTTIENPTDQTAYPLFKVTAATGATSGSFTVGDITVTIASIPSVSYIDSESQDCYSETDTINSQVTLTKGASPSDIFPFIPKDGAEITFNTNQIAKIEIVPRWYII